MDIMIKYGTSNMDFHTVTKFLSEPTGRKELHLKKLKPHRKIQQLLPEHFYLTGDRLDFYELYRIKSGLLI